MSEKVIDPKNLRGTPVIRQRDTYFSGATKEFSFVFGAAKTFVGNSHTGESDTENETKYVYIQEMCVVNTLKCKKFTKLL